MPVDPAYDPVIERELARIITVGIPPIPFEDDSLQPGQLKYSVRFEGSATLPNWIQYNTNINRLVVQPLLNAGLMN